MLIYKCRVADTQGEIQEVIVESESIESAETKLKKSGYILLSAVKTSGSGRVKIKNRELLEFTKSLSLLISSNLSLNDSIEVLKGSLKGKKVLSLTEKISSGLNRGESMLQVINKEISGLPPLYSGLIYVGEKTGNLKLILEQLTSYLERDKKVREKLSGSLIYPIFIMVMTLIFTLLFIFVMLPKFNSMFASLGGGLGDTLDKRATLLTVVVFTIIATTLLGLFTSIYIKKLKKRDLQRAANYEKLLLKLPFIGKLIIEQETYNLVFALSVLTKSSLSVDDALIYGREVIKNSYIKIQLEEISRAIFSGERLSEAFEKSIFPHRVSSFIVVGEKTGEIASIFSDLSDNYSRESDVKTEKLMGIIDPLFTLLTGGALFTLILLFILPVLTKMGELM